MKLTIRQCDRRNSRGTKKKKINFDYSKRTGGRLQGKWQLVVRRGRNLLGKKGGEEKESMGTPSRRQTTNTTAWQSEGIRSNGQPEERKRGL